MKEPIDRVSDIPSFTYNDGQTKQTDIKSVRAATIATADDNVNVSEPSTPTHSSYPYNKVEHSLSGHLFEVDDTPGAERLLEMHKSGTFYEIHPDGKKVTKIFGDDFYIVLDDKNLVVGGNLNITVQGNANLLVKGDMKTKVDGDYSLTVHGNMKTRVFGTRLDYTKNNHDLQTNANLKVRSQGKTDHYAKGNMNIQTGAAMIMDSVGSWTQYSGSHYKMTTSATYNIKSSGNTNIDSSGVVYVDGSQIHFNLPGPGVSAENPATNDPTDKDPGGGLIVPDVVIEPSFDIMKVARSDNNSLNTIINTDVTYPKDRTRHE